jgi:hypothetical protein
VTTQADSVALTNAIRTAEGVTGAGVTVGVISTGLFHESFGSLPAAPCNLLQLTGDLPPFGSSLEDCDTAPPSGFFGNIPVFPGLLTEHTVPSVIDFVELLIFPGFPEGAAMLEVIHDIVPDANLVYGDGRTDVTLELSREFIRSFAPDVMVENIIFTDAGRFDGTSFLSRQAREIALSGPTPAKGSIPYIVSVGGVTPANETGVVTVDKFPLQITTRFNGDPRDSREKVHSWSAGTTTQRDEALNFSPKPLPPPFDNIFEPISLSLVWDDYWDDDSPRATTDLDMYLVPTASLNLAQAVASSTRIQNGFASNPFETLFYQPTDETPLSVVIVKKDALNNSQTLFTLVIEEGRTNEGKYLTNGVPMNNADALPPVISVGHTDLALGPTALGEEIVPGTVPLGAYPADSPAQPASFLRWFEGQVSPATVYYGSVDTVSSLEGISATGFLERGFRGPSAAAAHLAGFAAMLRHRFPFMTGQRVYDILRDDSGLADNGTGISQLSTDLTADETEGFLNAPRYLRPNPFPIYTALRDGLIDPYSSGAAQASSNVILSRADLTTDWTFGPAEPIADMTLPQARVTPMGLELTPSSDRSFGWWESPLLALQDSTDQEPRTALRADRLYLVEVRVGTDESDPLRVPDFRLRLITGTGEESVTTVIAGLTPEGANTPSDLGGRVYRLYYRPSNQGVADQGVRLAFDLLNADPKDNPAATVVLRDVTFHELALPVPAGR